MSKRGFKFKSVQLPSLFVFSHFTPCVSLGNPDSRACSRELDAGSLCKNMAPGSRLKNGNRPQEGGEAHPRTLFKLTASMNICYSSLWELLRNLTKCISELATLGSKVRETFFHELVSLRGQAQAVCVPEGHAVPVGIPCHAAVRPWGQNRAWLRRAQGAVGCTRTCRQRSLQPWAPVAAFEMR